MALIGVNWDNLPLELTCISLHYTTKYTQCDGVLRIKDIFCGITCHFFMSSFDIKLHSDKTRDRSRNSPMRINLRQCESFLCLPRHIGSSLRMYSRSLFLLPRFLVNTGVDALAAGAASVTHIAGPCASKGERIS